MAARIILRPVESGDIAHVAANLCAGELRTMLSVYGPQVDIQGRVAENVLRSQVAHAAVVGGEEQPLALFGVVPLSIMRAIGSTWFLATERMFEHPRPLVVMGRRYVRDLLTRYDRLEGRVDARHEGVLKWLRLLGFAVHEPTRGKVVNFCHYEIEAKRCA